MAVAVTGMVLVAAPAVPVPAAARTAESLTQRIEERHRAVSDLTARFEQRYRSLLIGREVVERGVVSIKRPGRMRWEYQEPEKKTFVSDGKTFYFYVPADRQVVVRDQAGDKGMPALLLSGRGRILDEFTVAFEERSTPGRQRLRLVPRKPDPEVERVILDVDDHDRIRAIEVQDAQGNRSLFQFDAIRENVGLSDRVFDFKVPRGVEVISG